jgi:hypothetical protein
MKMKEKHELQRLKDEKLITWREENHYFKIPYLIKLLIQIQVKFIN